MPMDKKNWEKTFDAIDDWICIIDPQSIILRSNRTVEKFFHIRVQDSIGLTCCRLIHGTDDPQDTCPLPRMIRTKKREHTEIEMPDGRWMLITVDPILDEDGNVLSVVHIARDITRRIHGQQEKEALVADLKKALGEIKTLSGLLPICAHCKKIRDDQGYWEFLESYIETRSDASFSHGLCPDCMDQLYGKEAWYRDMKAQAKKSKKY